MLKTWTKSDLQFATTLFAIGASTFSWGYRETNEKGGQHFPDHLFQTFSAS